MSRRVEPYVIAYDLLWLNGKDLRELRLMERKGMLKKKLLAEVGWLRYSEHIGARGIDFFRVACEHDLEGVVAKLKTAPYSTEKSTWLKIKNPNYSQLVDRQERFAPKQPKIAANVIGQRVSLLPGLRRIFQLLNPHQENGIKKVLR
jgi:hypothetical protein